MSDLARDARRCEAQIVVASAINEGLTLREMQVFNKEAKPYNEDRVAREFGADALDHFRAIRHHRNELTRIVSRERPTTLPGSPPDPRPNVNAYKEGGSE